MPTYYKKTGRDYYHLSSPLNPRNFRFKALKLLEKDFFIFKNSTYKDLLLHPTISKENRTIVVLESNDTSVIEYFNIVSKIFKERVSAFIVTEKAKEYAINSDNYDNCYVLGPHNLT
jgi:uncharacterized protein YifN (PemK superfamily)